MWSNLSAAYMPAGPEPTMANEYCSFSSDDAEVNFLLKVVVVVAFFDPPLFFSLLMLSLFPQG